MLLWENIDYNMVISKPNPSLSCRCRRTPNPTMYNVIATKTFQDSKKTQNCTDKRFKIQCCIYFRAFTENRFGLRNLERQLEIWKTKVTF